MGPAFQRRVFIAFRYIFAAAVLALLSPMQAKAQENGRGFEPREIYMLPPFCKYTQIYRKHLPGGNDPAEIERLTAKMGEVFRHMHHYCWGVQESLPVRLQSLEPDLRRHNLLLAIGDFDYVIERAPLDFSMLPDVHTKKGEVLVQLDRGGEGMLEFQQALKLKPDYWQAYAAMSDYYKGSGQIAKAREALEKGLSVAPNSQTLKDRLGELHAAKGKRRTDP